MSKNNKYVPAITTLSISINIAKRATALVSLIPKPAFVIGIEDIIDTKIDINKNWIMLGWILYPIIII